MVRNRNPDPLTPHGLGPPGYQRGLQLCAGFSGKPGKRASNLFKVMCVTRPDLRKVPPACVFRPDVACVAPATDHACSDFDPNDVLANFGRNDSVNACLMNAWYQKTHRVRDDSDATKVGNPGHRLVKWLELGKRYLRKRRAKEQANDMS